MRQEISALVVDDDVQLRQMLGEYLTNFGVSVVGVGDGLAMEQAIRSYPFDLVLLDLNLPGEDGLSLCRRLRTNSDIPILILTARSATTDRVVGLEVGADDYLVKPFEPRELVARMQTVLRRSRRGYMKRGKDAWFQGWQLDLVSRHLVSPQKMVIPLSNAEFRLLAVLVSHPNQVLSRQFLLDEARGRDMELFDRSIDILISRVRHKLNDDPGSPALIKTVRGQGYLFDAAVSY